MLKRAIWIISVATAFVLAGAAVSFAGGGANSYRLSRLVSDQAGVAAHRDPHLINAWGLVAGPDTPWWVAAADANVSTIYDGTGAAVPLVVRAGGGPTGTVFNGGPNFVVSHGGASGPSLFLFATESGTIRGWNPGVEPPPPSTRAWVVVNRSGKEDSYKGLAINSVGGNDYLYATDFHHGEVRVFNGSFHLTNWNGAFEDPGLPNGYSPFGIQSVGGKILVTFAKQDADAEEEVAGAGLGFVDMFSARGRLLGRVASRGALNAPWGLAMAPAHFGAFGGDVLVGNFGNGMINAYRWTGSSFVRDGTLKNPGGHAISIDGLWAIEFGNGNAAGAKNALFFTAGPEDESHGLFGRITAGP